MGVRDRRAGVGQGGGDPPRAARRLGRGRGPGCERLGRLRDRPHRGALLVLTPEASVATWRANRTEGVRAASACDVDSVARAVKCLGVNVLVIEPALHSIPSMKAMAEAFRRGGAPTLPEGLR